MAENNALKEPVSYYTIWVEAGNETFVYAHKHHNEIIQIKIVTSRSEEIVFSSSFLFVLLFCSEKNEQKN